MNRILLSQQSYLISVLAHVLILIVGGLYFSNEVATVQVGNANEVLVQSYVDFTPQSITRETVTKVQQDKSIKLSDKKETVSRSEKVSSRAAFSAGSSDAKKSQSATQREFASSSRGESVEPLLVLLHAAIQAQQHYPESALEMQREGRVRVGFVLRPNGSIEQVALVKSSGTSSLDAAGLQAVQDAAPIKGVERYLDGVRAFEIDVVFGL